MRGSPTKGWVTVLATAEERLEWLKSAPMGTKVTWTHNTCSWIKNPEGWFPNDVRPYPEDHVAQFAFTVDEPRVDLQAEVERLSVNRDALQVQNAHLRAEITLLTGANQTSVREIERLQAKITHLTHDIVPNETYCFHAGDILKVERNGVEWYGKVRESRKRLGDWATFSLLTSEGHIEYFNLNDMGKPNYHYEVLYSEHRRQS